MSLANILTAINTGYAITAQQVGSPYSHYRPTASGALASGNLLGTLNVSFAQGGNYLKPGKVGVSDWWAYYDQTNVQVGDYFTSGTRTYFVSSQQTLLPAQAVFCERVVNLLSVTQSAGVGTGSYGGNTGSVETSLLTAWPASIVQGSRGEKGDITLPDDVRSPWWTIRLPVTPGVVIQDSYIITDDLSRSYTVSSAELSEYGWRCSCRANQV